MGQPPIRNTFKSKNTYENILTGINKEEVDYLFLGMALFFET